MDRTFGGATKHRALLEHTVTQGVATDCARNDAAIAAFRQQHAAWATNVRLASGVLKFEHAACAEALTHADAFGAVQSFKTSVKLDKVATDVATLSAVLHDDEIVPREEVKLTASGKLTTKDMAIGKYWALFQDHVCSCALRIALETFAVIPVGRAIVNIAVIRRDTSTGHSGAVAILAVHFMRNAVEDLNLEAIDPSDSMKNFPHRMRFKKTTGFEPIDVMTDDEQWVTT